MKVIRALLFLFLIWRDTEVIAQIANPDSINADIDELVQGLNGGLGSEEVRVFIRETKIKEALVLVIDQTASRLNSENSKCILYMALAYNFFDAGNFNETQPLLLKSLALAEKLNNLKYQCAVYNVMANLFSATNMNEKSFSTFRKAITIAEELKNEDVLCTLYANWATGFYRSFETNRAYLDSARKYNNKSLALAIKLGKKESIHMAYQCEGLIETDAFNFEAAEKAFRKAMKLNEELNIIDFKCYTACQLARLFNDQSKQELADSSLKYLEIARKLAIEENDGVILGDILYELARANRIKGNFELSSKYALRFAEYNDSMIKYENSRIMVEMSEKYEAAKSAAKINELNVMQKEKQAQINRQLYLIIGGVVVLIFVGIVAFSLYRSNKIRKRINNQLNEKNKLIEHQKEIVDSKNKAILDSIYYAKRIQQSLLPSTKYLERNFEKLKNPSKKS